MAKSANFVISIEFEGKCQSCGTSPSFWITLQGTAVRLCPECMEKIHKCAVELLEEAKDG